MDLPWTRPVQMNVAGSSDGTKSDCQPIPMLDLRFILLLILIYLGSQIPKLRLEVESFLLRNGMVMKCLLKNIDFLRKEFEKLF